MASSIKIKNNSAIRFSDFSLVVMILAGFWLSTWAISSITEPRESTIFVSCLSLSKVTARHEDLSDIEQVFDHMREEDEEHKWDDNDEQESWPSSEEDDQYHLRRHQEDNDFQEGREAG